MKKLLIIAIFIVSFLSNVAFAATVHDISISGLPIPSGVEAFNITYSTSNFALDPAPTNATLGSAIPPAISLGWGIDAETASATSFNLQISDLDALLNNNPNPMLNGNIASFSYTGTILDVTSFQFGDIDGVQIPSISLTGLTQTNTTFNAVPIPGSILLLGSGLVGLIGIARRKRS